jgi:hypothetical protein
VSETGAGSEPASGVSPPETERDAGVRSRRVVAGLLAMLVVAAAAWTLVGARLDMTAQKGRGERAYAAPVNGDHMYYASMALQFTGVPYLESLDEVSDYFQYPLDWRRAYFLNPEFTLVYPRTVLPLLATPFVAAMGPAAVFVPGIACGLATLALIVVAARRWGAAWAVAPPLAIYALSEAWSLYGTGVLTESVLMLVVISALLCLPVGGARPGVSGAVWLAALSVVAGLTRQTGLVPGSMAAAGLIGAVLLAHRGERRSTARLWAVPTASALAAGALVTAYVSVWAPYDPLAFSRRETGASGLRAAITAALKALPGNVVEAFRELPAGSWAFMLLLVLGCLASLLMLAEPLGWVILGAAAMPVATAALNGTDVLRYLSPVYPLFVVAQAVVLHRLLLRWRRYAALVGQQPSPRSPASVTSTTWSVVAATLVVLALVGASVWVYRPAEQVDLGTMSRADLGTKAWPFRADSVEVSCGGDNGQIWVTSEGRSYAFTSSAMARRWLGVPVAIDLRAPSTRTWSAQSFTFLNYVLTRCPVGEPIVAYP